jgi:hypothetical protein
MVVNVTVWFVSLLVPPAGVAYTVTGSLLVGLSPPDVIVRVDDPLPVIEVWLKLPLRSEPLGKGLSERFTVPVKPGPSVIVTVAVVVPPLAMKPSLGEMETVKLPVWPDCTV